MWWTMLRFSLFLKVLEGLRRNLRIRVTDPVVLHLAVTHTVKRTYLKAMTLKTPHTTIMAQSQRRAEKPRPECVSHGAVFIAYDRSHSFE